MQKTGIKVQKWDKMQEKSAHLAPISTISL